MFFVNSYLTGHPHGDLCLQKEFRHYSMAPTCPDLCPLPEVARQEENRPPCGGT